MQVKYKDGDEEDIILSNEKIKFFVSPEEMQHLNLSHGVGNSKTDNLDINEMVVLAASLDDCHELDRSKDKVQPEELILVVTHY